jgi:holliday junction DNA helicase RuvA
MLHYLRGNITMRFDGGIVVETGGLGYRVFVPDNSPLYLDTGKEAVLVYTAMIVREDDMSLYGFPDKDSLELFQKLRTVNGVGAKAALAVLSAMPLGEVKKAILFDDAATLTRANGIGKKTAQRIVLELKDKLGDIGGLADLAEQVASESGKAEAINALIGLGYSRSEAVGALVGIEGDNLTTEDYIKKALRGIAIR